MVLQINLVGNNIELVLKDGRKIIDESRWQGEHALSEQLLPQIDALLEKNAVSREKIILKSRIGKLSGITSSRIVQTVVKAWNIAINVR